MAPAIATVARHLQAAAACRGRGAWDEAAASIAAAEAAAAGDARGSALVGDVHTSLGDYVRAFACYDRAVALSPSDPGFLFNRAAVRRFLGQLDAAEADYDRCVELDPGDIRARLNRSELRSQTPDRNHVAELEQLVLGGFSSWGSEVAARYALAKEYEDLGEYASSWRHLSAGASLRRRHLAYDLQPDLLTVDWLIDTFPAGHPRSGGDGSGEPIFIVGMPRTGSTLVDRILGSHTQVYSAGELVHFGNAVVAVVAAAQRQLGRQGTRQELIAASAGVDFAALGAEYLRRSRPQTGHTPRFTDKLPLNYLYCGLIAAALPNARIVHVSRHPMATCYAIYKVLFEQGYPFSYDLGEIADYYAGYRRLMAHWNATLPERIIEIEYESLIADPSAESARLIADLGLPWEATCLDFHRNPAATATASAVQVRRPIYATAVSQWRNYAAELEPLRERLEKAGVRCD